MAATNQDIVISVGEQEVSGIRKYVPSKYNPLDYETAATHGLVDGKLYGVIERGSYSLQLSNGEYYQKNCKSVIWLRLYEIDYSDVDFSTW